MRGYPFVHMLDDMRRYVRFGLQALGAQDPPRGEAKRSAAHTLGDQMSSLAAGLLEWSAEARASLLQELKDLIARQVEEMGVATKKDLDGLERRIEQLEGRSRTRTSRSKATSRTATSKTNAKTSTSRAKKRTSTSKIGGRGARSSRGSR